jgi:hypothetical protein
MTRIITGGDRRKDPRFGRLPAAPEPENATIANDHIPDRPDVVSDLNALFLMVGYVEMELERIAPECVLAASTLRSAIVNEMLVRTSRDGEASARDGRSDG